KERVRRDENLVAIFVAHDSTSRRVAFRAEGWKEDPPELSLAIGGVVSSLAGQLFAVQSEGTCAGANDTFREEVAVVDLIHRARCLARERLEASGTDATAPVQVHPGAL